MKKCCIFFICVICLSACNTSRKQDDVLSIVSNGNNVSWRMAGTGDTTLLFIHGWCINREYWAAQEKYFGPNYKVVSVDLPGFGFSGKNIDSTRSFGAYTEDVKALIDGLKLTNVVLIGHSMSGDIIIDMSRRFPEKIIGVVGVDNLHQPAGPFNNTTKQEVLDFFNLFYVKYDSIVGAVMEKELFQPSTDSLIKKRVIRDILSCDRRIAVNVLRANTLFAQQQKETMRSLNHKLNLLNSDVYPVNTDSLAKYCAKGFRVETVHGSGHYPMVEMPDAFNQALEKLIREIK